MLRREQKQKNQTGTETELKKLCRANPEREKKKRQGKKRLDRRHYSHQCERGRGDASLNPPTHRGHSVYPRLWGVLLDSPHCGSEWEGKWPSSSPPIPEDLKLACIR